METTADIFGYGLLGRVQRLRLHDVVRHPDVDPRYSVFQRVYDTCQGNIQHQAAAIALWVTTRSKDLLGRWAELRNIDNLLQDPLFEPVSASRMRAPGKRPRTGDTIRWKANMPSESRDRLVNRQTNDRHHSSYIFRHIPASEALHGTEHDTVDSIVQPLSEVPDTGEFSCQHAWALLKTRWVHLRGEVVDSRTAFKAVSQQNTTQAAKRILVDHRRAKDRTPDHEKDADGYYNVGTTDDTVRDLIAAAHRELATARFNWRWTTRYCIPTEPSSDLETAQRSTGSISGTIRNTDEPCACWFTYLTNLCMLEKVLHDLLD